MRLEPYIAMRFLRARQKNKFVSLVAIFAVGGIMIGVAALIVSLSAMNGFENEVRSRIIGTTSHINVHSLRADHIQDWVPLVQRLRERKDVVAAAPFIYTKMPVAHKGNFDGMILRGVLPEMQTSLGNPGSTVVDGIWLPDELDTSRIPPIVLGIYLADGLGAKPGDTVLIYGIQGQTGARITPKINRFLVEGIFETGMFDFDAILAYTHLEAAQKLLEMGDAVTGIELRIQNFYEADKIADRLDDEMGFPYYALSWVEMNKNLFAWMTLEKWGLFLLLTLIIAVAAFNIASTLIMVVMEKTPQIGILRAMGATAKRIRRIFFLQGLFVGVLGTVLGYIVGFTLAFIQNKWEVISLPADVYSISSLPIEMHGSDFVIIGIIAMAITVLSSIYPAWRASKETPIDAIRR
ncbi:MAG: FtsX-like permease family protein [bacterium]